jgi:thioredoxin reductase (NADPH)
VVGDEPSPPTHEVCELLARRRIPYGLARADSAEGRQLLADTGRGADRLPVVVLLDGRALVQPSRTELSDALGESDPEERGCDVAVVGAGPAGLAAAVSAASEGWRTVVIEPDAVGGQAGTSSLIRNYLGFPRGISGAELAQRAYQQAWLFGAKYVFARGARSLELRGPQRVLALDDGGEIAARAVIVATGASYRRIGVPSLERFSGAGLYYVAAGDPRWVHGRDVFVVGGGNSAGQATAWLAEHARTVTLLVRGEALAQGMSDYLVRQIARLRNVEVRLRSEVIDARGDRSLEEITVRDRARGEERRMPATLLFAHIGAQPHTAWLGEAVQRDRHGFVLTGKDVAPSGWPLSRPPLSFETSVPGVFAVGDVRAGSVKRVASAVGEGSVGMHFVQGYLAAEGAPPHTGERPSAPAASAIHPPAPP